MKDVLDKVGLKKEAIEIAFNGADGPVSDKTPDFVKSIPIGKALEDTTLIAYEMNGQPLPHFNGFPARIIVPGWTAVYWVKHVTSISALTKPQGGYWMTTAYRIPLGKFPIVAQFPTQETDVNTPITEMVVNSLITSPLDGEHARAGQPLTVGGLAWDAGYGIEAVEFSGDDGKTWSAAALGEDLGRFAFRSWSASVTPKAKGKLTIKARASNKIGQTADAGDRAESRRLSSQRHLQHHARRELRRPPCPRAPSPPSLRPSSPSRSRPPPTSSRFSSRTHPDATRSSTTARAAIASTTSR